MFQILIRVFAKMLTVMPWLFFPYTGHSSHIIKHQHVLEFLNELNGESTGWVFALEEASDGTIWVGTDNGLGMIQGNSYRKFVHDPLDTTSLSNNQIRDLFIDSNQRLWIATYGGGLSILDLHSLHFSHILQGANGTGLSSRFVGHIDMIGDHSIAVGTTRGVDLIDLETLSVNQLLEDSPPDVAYMNLYLTEGNDDDIWFSSYENGLQRLNTKTLQIETYQQGLSDSINILGNQVSALYKDSRNRVWVGTEKGVTLISASATSSEYINLNRDNLPANFTHSIVRFYEDNTGKLWLSSRSLGLFVFDEQNGAFEAIGNTKHEAHSFNTLDVLDILQSRNGNYYFATQSYGLVNVNEYFDAFTHMSFYLDGSKDYSISQMLLDSEGNTWVAANESLYKLEEQRLVEIVKNTGYIYRLEESRPGTLIYASIGSGLYRFNHSQVQSDDNPKLIYRDPEANLSEFAVSKDEHLLLIYNGIQRNLNVLIQNENERNVNLNATYIQDLVKVGEDAYLIAAHNTNGKGQIIYFQFSSDGGAPKIEVLVPNVNAECVIGIANQRIWFCDENTKGGVSFYDQNQKSITNIQPSRALSSGLVISGLIDPRGNVWLVTEKGISVVLTSDLSIFHLSKEDGLLFESSSSAPPILRGQELLFAANSGIVSVDQQKFQKQLQTRLATEHNINVSNLKLFDPSALHQPTQRKAPTVHNLRSGAPISFDHDQFLISFEFNTDQFNLRNNVDFEHRLLGLNEHWLASNFSQNQTIYTQLPTGDYILEARAVDPKSRRIQPVSRINFVVLPPWWKTWWAQFIYLCAFLMTIISFHNLRLRRIKTYTKQLEQGIANRTRELSESNSTIEGLLKDKLALFSNVSHEFRTPLTIVLGHVHALAEEPLSPHGKNRISIINRSAKGLLKLVDQLLDLSELDNKRPQKKHLYNVKSTLEAVINSLDIIAQSKNQTLELQCNDMIFLELQEDSLEKIALNIVFNAVKYSDADSLIKVTVKARGDTCIISFIDNGRGIATENLNDVFERFVRMSTTTQTTGSGIGLALVKELTQANGGNISVLSKVGEGTEFTLTLPLPEHDTKNVRPAIANSRLLTDFIDGAVPPSQVKPVATELDAASDKPVVLIVEDNPDLIALINEALSEFQCLYATNGAEGLTIARLHIPDIIVSDIVMPKMDGVALLKNIREYDLTSHIPFVLITAIKDEQSRIKGWQENVDDYITKPFNPQELNIRLKNLLELRNLVRRRLSQMALETKDGACDTDPNRANTQIVFENIADEKFFRKFSQVIKKNYEKESFNRNDAAAQMAVSERQLNRKLNALFGHNFTDYLRQFRLQEATRLLAAGHQVTQICYAVGFNSPSYFSSRFKAAYGVTPKEYQNRSRNRQNIDPV